MEKELLKALKYSACDCAIDYKEKLGIVNGICPNHSNSHLMINGIRADAIQKLKPKKKLDNKISEII